MSSEPDTFLDTANASEKTFGNNRFQEEIKSLSQELEKVKSEKAQLKELNTVYEDTIASLRESIETQKNTLDASTKKLESQDAQHTAEKKELQEKITQITNSNNAKSDQIGDLQQKLTLATKASDEVSKKLADLESKIANLEMENNALRESVTRKDNLIKESNDAILLFQKEIEMNNALVQKLNDEINYHKTNITQLTSTNNDLTELVQTQTAEIQKLSDQVVEVPTRTSSRSLGTMRRR
ncbi:hypothetical protein EB118_03485 [bacterium]|nr:hypothetical protein [bacterium]NDC94042.1 hypothetical protein [bacterium]NDD82728.1 hypothetical protein [bacterium]NDG29148.1 hypothetical protein [bacterium]